MNQNKLYSVSVEVKITPNRTSIDPFGWVPPHPGGGYRPTANSNHTGYTTDWQVSKLYQ